MSVSDPRFVADTVVKPVKAGPAKPAAMSTRYELVLYGEHTLTDVPTGVYCTRCGARDDWTDDLDRGCHISHEWADGITAARVAARSIVIAQQNKPTTIPGDWERARFDAGDVSRFGGVLPLPDGTMIAVTLDATERFPKDVIRERIGDGMDPLEGSDL